MGFIAKSQMRDMQQFGYKQEKDEGENQDVPETGITSVTDRSEGSGYDETRVVGGRESAVRVRSR